MEHVRPRILESICDAVQNTAIVRVARSGREALTAPSLEIYRNSPWNTRPEDLVTDIHLPLAE